MRTTCLVIILGVAFLSARPAHGQRLTLVKEGRSDYRIIVPQTPSESERRGASELQHFLHRISGVKLPIEVDTVDPQPREILLGDNARLAGLEPKFDVAPLGDDGFTIRTVEERLVIVGGPGDGTLNGVYTFLEDYLGCRWYSSRVGHVPKAKTIRVHAIDDTQVPAFRFREVYYSDAMDPDYARRHKLNGNASIVRDGRLVEEMHRGWGLWCHSFFSLVPPDTYFDTHPEYFSLVDGKRVRDKQLCLTNPDVLRITLDSLRRMMAEEPDAHYWSVSQMDWAGACQCDACRAIDEREESPMGTLLTFVNRIAAEFPDKTISTLAYQYTRRPPKTLRPADNVLINLCSIECIRNRPIATAPRSASFREDLESWSAVCDQLFVWDYVVQFKNLVSPFPNFHVLQPDVQIFEKNHVVGLFSQGNREAHGEFCELRAYLLAKLQWNPDCDVEALMADFLRGYYGDAAKPLRRYIDEMHSALHESGDRLQIFGNPQAHRRGHLSEERVARYGRLFDKAERRVAEDEDILLRVKAARMPLQYAQLQLRYGDVAEREQVAKELFETAERVGLHMFNEWSLPTDEYRAQITEALAKERAAK